MSIDIIFFLMTNIGPRRPMGYPRYRHRARDGEGPVSTMTLESVRDNMSSLTNIVPARNIEDIPEAYQR